MVVRRGVLCTLAIGILAVVFIVLACSNESAAERTNEVDNGTVGSSGDSSSSDGLALSASRSLLNPIYGVNGDQTGIHVVGIGVVIVDPDVCIISMGVEAREDTVERARKLAALAMDAVWVVLMDLGISDDDIKTLHYNIQPEYVWSEVVKNGKRQSKQELSGYRVTNNIEVKLRDLERSGQIIDAATMAGGDFIQIHGVSFTVENPIPFEMEAREVAVKEAKAKAERMAKWAGARLGQLFFLSEVGSPSPINKRMSLTEVASSRGLGLDETSIMPGDMEVRVTVQAAWAVY